MSNTSYFEETFLSPADLGKDHLDWKIRQIKEQYPDAKVDCDRQITDIPQAGSTSTPYASNYGRTEPGYRIIVKRPRTDIGSTVDRRV